MDIGHVKGIGRATFICRDYNINIIFRVCPLCTTAIKIYNIVSGYFKSLTILSIA